MAEDSDAPQNRKRNVSGGSDHGDDEPRFKRRYSESGTGRYECRLLVQSKEAGTIIGRGGDNIKRLRQDFKAGIQVSDNRGPERIATISGDLEVISDVLLDLLRMFEDKRQSERSSRREEAELRMMVHQSQAGCVIGKAGSKLKEMRLEHGVDIKVFAQCCPMSTDRIVRAIGTPDKVTRCLISILDLLRTWPPKGYENPYDPVNADPMTVHEYGGYVEEGGHGGGSRGGRFSEDRYGDRDRRGGGSGMGRERDRMGSMGGGAMNYPIDVSRGMGGMSMSLPGPVTTQQVSIPADMAGIIIGKGGQKIKQVRIESGAEVELSDGTGGNSDRIISITGTLQQIQTAQYLLQMTVKQHLERK